MVPVSMQQVTLTKLHQGHQGIERCRQRARISVWWPGLSLQIEKFVKSCQECVKECNHRREPLIPTTLPDYPWQKIGTDLFILNGATYLVASDYFSWYLEVTKLTNTTTSGIVSALKPLFAKYGLPEEVVSDNGPQYASQEFGDFAKEYNFKHTTSSPHFPQSNGHAERAVQTARDFSKTPRIHTWPCCRTMQHLYLGVDFHQHSCSWDGKLDPTSLKKTEALIPQWPYFSNFRRENEKEKQKQKFDFNTRHGTRALPETPDNTAVPGHVTTPAKTPRSYLVETPSGQVRRNQSHLIVQPQPEEATPSHSANRSPIMTRSRTRTNILPP